MVIKMLPPVCGHFPKKYNIKVIFSIVSCCIHFPVLLVSLKEKGGTLRLPYVLRAGNYVVFCFFFY